MNIYDYKYKEISGKEVLLEDYRNKAIVIVNIASKCGFTPQLEDLQKIYEKYKEHGFEIIGFPSNQFNEQSPGSVTFNLSEKVDVRGSNSHPLFNYLTEKCPFKGFNKENITEKMLYSITEENYPEYLVGDSIKWNFTKFLVDKNGNVVKRYESHIEPLDMIKDIEELL